MNVSLENLNALVCGSTQGIGLATAQQLAELGATVTLVARNEERLKNSLNTLSTIYNQKHDYIRADFSQPETLEANLNTYLANGTRIHILINNTGGPRGGLIQKASVLEFRAAFEMHLVCNHILSTSLKQGMQAAGYGRIINVISTSVKQPLHNLGVSNTIRAAVANWAKTMANELGRYGITVNNVLPGATDTARLQSILKNKANRTGKTREAISEEMKSVIPAGRFAKAEEIANAIAFLASPAAAYINGINLPVDGGRTKCL